MAVHVKLSKNVPNSPQASDLKVTQKLFSPVKKATNNDATLSAHLGYCYQYEDCSCGQVVCSTNYSSIGIEEVRQ